MSSKTKRTFSMPERSAKVRKLKFEPTNLEPSKGKSPTDILNLNDDCLEEIFTYLNDIELLSVIRTNTRFKLPCEQVFKRKYCRDTIIVSNFHGTRLNAQKLNHSLNILQHFGHLISKLCIRFKLEKIESLLEAVTANCDENLFELELHHLGIRVVRPLELYAEGLEMMRSFLSNLTTQFPKLTHLKFDYCNTSKKCPYSDVIVQPIPTLTSFATTEASAGHFFTEKGFKKFFWLNRQLESLSLRIEVNELDDTDRSWHISPKFITYLDQTLPLLKSLEINRVSILHLPETANYTVRFMNLKQLTFYCFLEFQNADCGFMSFLSESVEVLKLSTFDVNIANFLKNVTRFKQLKVLELEFPLELASRILSNDQRDAAVWSPNGIRQLILGNPHLTEIVVRQHPSEIDDEWEWSYPGNYYLHFMQQRIVNDKLNGCQWKIDSDSSSFSFRKIMEK